ncbi:MAG: Ig-like domain-containing protein [Prevotellaceae bacterium]|nr:Ig-like domain-containing protein [Prevotellaceae bacterium]
MAVAAITISACGSDDPAPTPNPPGGQTVAVTGVSLNKTTMSIVRGRSETLTATVAPENATNKAVTWATSNAQVATVSNGAVTAVATGSATITVTTADGNRTATCVVTVVNPEYDVYVAGSVRGSNSGQVPAYWKNGTLVVLDGSSDAVGGGLMDIAVSGNNVYALGMELLTEGSSVNAYAKYWTDGQATPIGEVNTIPTRMEVVNSNVHIVGATVANSTYNAKYWLNGNDMNISGDGKIATDISIYGNKYYISGYALANQQACIWHNSATSTPFTYDPGQGEAVSACVLNSIHAYGDDLYSYGGYADVIPHHSSTPVRWAFLPGYAKSGESATMSQVYRYDGISYGAGYYINSGRYEAFVCGTGGTPTQILSTNAAKATSICVIAGDVYVGGTENDVAVYWKNGTKHVLGNSGEHSTATAIVVVERP